MSNLTQSKNYRVFTNDRNEALEKILRNSQLRITEQMDKAFVHILDILKSRYNSIKMTHSFSKLRLKELDNEIDKIFFQLNIRILSILFQMRKKSYTLSYSASFQSLKDQYDLDSKPGLDKGQIHKKTDKKFSDIDPQHKIDHALSKIKYKILEAVTLSIIMDEDENAMLGRVYKVLPKKKLFPKKPALKRVVTREASYGTDISLGKKASVSIGTIDPETWRQIVDDVQNDYTPTDRSPANVFDIMDPYSDMPIRDELPTDESIYGWEIERDTTHDFVSQVRSGEIQAANENGIDDFMWIAILDDRTCSNCCEWRDGLLSSEIEEKLKQRPDLKEACDAVVAPAHFNCRCQMVPASSKMEPVDESESKREFQEWLMS